MVCGPILLISTAANSCIAVCRLVGRVQAASCKVKVNSSIVELLLSYYNDSSLNGTVYFTQTLHSSNQPANCNTHLRESVGDTIYKQTCQVSLFGSETHTFLLNLTLTHQHYLFLTLFWYQVYKLNAYQ